MKRMRILRGTAALLIMVLAFSGVMTGCSDKEETNPEPENIVTDVMGNYYFLINNIQMMDIDDDEGFYFEISGLKDKEVEQKINDKIYEKYLELRDDYEVPGYDEVKKSIAPGEYPLSSRVMCYASASINNILSIEYTCDKWYQEISCTDTHTMNIDLRTGEEFSIGDIFTEGTDYETLIKDYVNDVSLMPREESMEYYDFPIPRLKSTFEGIRPDQKFYIDEYAGTLVLVFDHENEEIDFSVPYYEDTYGSLSLSMDIDAYSALQDRFYNENECIFEDETKIYELPCKTFYSDKRSDIEKSDYITVDGINFRCWISDIFCENLPSAPVSLAREKAEPDQEYLKEVAADIKSKISDNIPEDTSVEVNYGTYMDRCGKFSNIIVTQTFTYYPVGGGGKYYQRYDDRYYCFSANDKEPMSLEDVFVKGRDIENLIKDGYRKRYEESLYSEFETPVQAEEKVLEEFYDEIFENINGFALETNTISLSYDNLDDIIQKYFGEETDQFAVRRICTDLLYSYFNSEDLDIFN